MELTADQLRARIEQQKQALLATQNELQTARREEQATAERQKLRRELEGCVSETNTYQL